MSEMNNSWITKQLSGLSTSFFVINSMGWLGILAFNIITRHPYLETLDQYLGLSSFYVVGYIVSFVVRFAYKRIEVQTNNIAKLGIIVLIISYIFGTIWFWADLGVSILMFGYDRYQQVFAFPNYLIRTFLPWLIMLVWGSLYFIVKFWRQWVVEKNKAREAEILLQESELKLLRYQVNPHFLFNSLNSIRALTLKDPSLVRGMVTELSEF